MALVACKECGREVSSSAPTCPGCGSPIKREGTSFGTGCLAFVLLLGGLVALISALNDTGGPPPRAAVSSPVSPPVSPQPSIESQRHPFEPLAQGDAVALRQVQRLINAAGARCDAVANMRGGGKIDNGDTLLIADCAGGDSHTVLLTPDERIRYYMACGFINPVC